MSGSDSISLLFKAKGDTADAKRDFENLKDSINRDISAIEGKSRSGFGAFNSSTLLAAAGGVALGDAIARIPGLALQAATAIFDLTKQTSDYGSEIFDASEKTSLGAETLSALRYAAETSGSSFESVVGSVAKFNVVLGEAANGSEKAQATLDKYGVTAKDTQGALEQAIKAIASETDATKQAAAAKELFRDRTADILPIIKSFDGDLPALMTKLRGLGLLMSDENARAADDFGDQLTTLQGQAAGLGRQFAFELMPYMTRAMVSISATMAANKGEAGAWAKVLVEAAGGVGVTFQFLTFGIRNNLALIDLAFGTSASKTVTSAGIMREAIITLIPPLNLLVQLQRAFGSATADTAATVKFSTDSIIDSLKRLPNLAIPNVAVPGATTPTTSSATRVKAGETPKEREEREKREDEERRRKDFQERLGDLQRRWEKLSSTAELVQTQAERRLAKGLVDEQYVFEIKLGIALNLAKAKLELLEKELQAAQQYGQKTIDIEARISVQKDQIEKVKAENEIAWQERVNKARKESEDAKTKYDEDEKRRRREWQQHAQEQQEFWRRESAALEEKGRKEEEERLRKKQQQMEDSMVTAPGSIGGGIAGALGVDLVSIFNPDVVGQMKSGAAHIKDIYADVKQMAGEAIGSMISGLASLAAQWLATGKFSAQAALQMASGVLIGLAIQAGVKAIFEYAEGMAALATFNPKSAALHFAAAAIYGKVALGAGIAGVVTGLGARAFQRESSTSPGSSAVSQTRNSGGRGQVFSSQEEMIVETSRNNPGGRGILGRQEVVLTIRDRSNWFAEMFKMEIARNSDVRTLIRDTAAA